MYDTESRSISENFAQLQREIQKLESEAESFQKVNNQSWKSFIFVKYFQVDFERTLEARRKVMAEVEELNLIIEKVKALFKWTWENKMFLNLSRTSGDKKSEKTAQLGKQNSNNCWPNQNKFWQTQRKQLLGFIR